MRNLCMTVCYDGTNYHGFQTQPGLDTVQDQLEKAIRLLTGEEVKITASGRTDAGVHARGQLFNFMTASTIPLNRWGMAINSRLPGDIRIWNVVEVRSDFHARRSVARKTYRYSIRCGVHPDVFNRHREYHHYSRLNLETMREGLSHLVGEHDFTTFCSARSDKPSHVRTLYDARIDCEPYNEELQSYVMHISLTGNGFLYNMVRIIVGTLIEVGMGKRTSDSIPVILKAMDRSLAGPTAASHGLMLWEVVYDQQFIIHS